MIAVWLEVVICALMFAGLYTVFLRIGRTRELISRTATSDVRRLVIHGVSHPFIFVPVYWLLSPLLVLPGLTHQDLPQNTVSQFIPVWRQSEYWLMVVPPLVLLLLNYILYYWSAHNQDTTDSQTGLPAFLYVPVAEVLQNLFNKVSRLKGTLIANVRGRRILISPHLKRRPNVSIDGINNLVVLHSDKS